VNLAETVDINHLMDQNASFGLGEIEQLQHAISSPQVSDVRQAVSDIKNKIAATSDADPKTLSRLGISYYLLSQHRAANECLSQVSGDAAASYYHGLVLSALEQHEEAAQKFEQAAANGYDSIHCRLMQAGEIRALGRLDEASEVLQSVSKEAAGRAEYSYQNGCICADRGDSFGAIEYFERAVDMDPYHSRALFWLAGENARHGNDDEAIRLYEQSLSKPPYYTGAILNLGLLYEDREQYPAAAYCFNRVLESDPNNERAQLYLKDIEATSEMYYDEDIARREARLEHLLSRPISDFELSVRSRNCLEAMGIMTLGDLTEISEQELLAGKNFGETSLHEIREMLTAHELRIGQNLHKAKTRDPMFDQTSLTPAEQSQMVQPISDLNLSVRSRKCMSRLGITTIGELLARTADELLASRNFGVTSLNEIRAKLTEVNLKLRND